MTRTHKKRSEGTPFLNAVTLLYVAYIPFDILPVAFGRTLTAPLAILLIFTWILSQLRRPEKVNFPRSAGILLFLYCFWGICTIFWSADTGTSLLAVQTILLQAPVVVILSNTLRQVWLPSLVTLGCSTGVLALVALSRPPVAIRAGRANVGGIDENVTAMILAAGFAALVYLGINLAGRRAALFVPLAVVTGAATLHTGSRTGAVAAVAALGVGVLPSIWRGRRRPATWFWAAGVMALISYASFSTAVKFGSLAPRIKALLSQRAAYQDTSRSEIIDLFLRTFDHWALIGVGIGNDANYAYASEMVFVNAHSLFWKTWIETGLIGLMILTAFLLVVVRQGFRSVASQALFLMAIPLVIFAYTLGGAQTSVFWFVIALALTQDPEQARPRKAAQPQTHVDLLPQAANNWDG